jgi:hypothetical protein
MSLLYQFTKKCDKTVVIIVGYHCCQLHTKFYPSFKVKSDRLCGLLVRVLDYRSGGPGSFLGTTGKKLVGLERGPLSLLSTTEELLDRKVAASV